MTFLLVIQFQARCHPKYPNLVGCRQNCAGLWTKQKLLEDVTWKQRLVVFIIISVILFTNILLVSSVSFKMHHSSRRLQSRKYSVYSAISLHARLAFLSCLSCAVGDVIAAQSVLSSIRRLYADYTWLFDRVPTWLLRQSVSECVEDVARWFLENGLLLNPAKTEADGSSPIWHHGLAWKDSSSKWHWCGRDGSSVPRHCQAARWYTRLSPDVRPARHSSSIIHVHCGTSDIRPLLTFDAAKTTAHSIVSSRLDYANALLHGTSASNLDRLQVAQNSLARAVCQAPRSASATELRRQLHWLSIRQRVTYMIAIITHKTRSTCLLIPVSPHPWLPSTHQQEHYDHLNNCYWLYRGRRWHCRRKPSVSMLIQYGTHGHTTVDLPNFLALLGVI